MEKISTAEEILVENSVFKDPEISNFNLIVHRDCYIAAQKNIKRAMIEFAKMHVEQFAKDFNLSCDYRQHLVETYLKKII
jgi:hypothetical protein